MQNLTCTLRELKFAADDGAQAMSFTGYGAVFGNVDSYGDVIEAGAFSKFLADVKSGEQPWPAKPSGLPCLPKSRRPECKRTARQSPAPTPGKAR